jgi:hypothetical protein
MWSSLHQLKVGMERHVPVMMIAQAKFAKVAAVAPIMVLPVIQARIAAVIKAAAVMARVRINNWWKRWEPIIGP